MKRILLLSLVAMFVFSTSWAQRTVTGTVTGEEDSTPVPGVNVIVKGTSAGTVTDIDGKYQIGVPDDGGILVFSFIGLATEEVEIGNQSQINMVMTADIKQLTEIVVTALGVTREKASLGYSVQEVDGDEVAASKEVNIVNALQGQVAGVQIQGTTGALGGTSRITIRGVNSFLGNNQPLFVVDGVPVDNSNNASNSQARGFGGGAYDYGNTGADINPQDVATVNVLKGAAATALYGVRGANGVIVITTKNGSQKKGLGVTVNSALTLDNVNNLIPHQTQYGGGAVQPTSSGFTEFTQDGQSYLAPAYGKDGAWGPKYDPSVMVRHWDSWDPNAENYKETRPWVAPANPYENYFETGQTWTNSVALEGSNADGNFRLGYTNVDQKGVFPNSKLKQNTLSLNAGYNIAKGLKVSSSVNFINKRADGRNTTGYDNSNPMQAFTQWWQTQLDVDRLQNYQMVDGSQYTWNAKGITTDDEGNLLSYDPSPQFFDNPYYTRNEFLQNDERNRIIGNVEVSYAFNDKFSIAGKAMLDNYTWKIFEGIPTQSVDLSRYSEETRTFNETNYDLRLNYNDKFGDFSLSVIAGANSMHQVRTFTRLNTVGGLALDGFWHLSNSIQPIEYVNGNNHWEESIQSIYALASLGWKDMLFLDASVRTDWASTLPEAENPFTYPSVSGSWVFSEMLSSNVISFGKIRAGYGEAANRPGPYSLEPTYAPVTPNFGSAPRYAVPNSRNNPNLRPEFTKEFEVGLEMNFWNNRLGFDVSYYDRKTTDQIFPVSISAATGFTSQNINAGTMKNSGVELMINATPVVAGDFKWDLMFNFATFNNEVVELADGIESLGRGGTWAAELRVQEGYPYMAIWGQDFKRENFETDESGKVIRNEGSVVVDGDGLPSTTGQRIYLGSAIADYAGGLRNTFSWKGISLGALIDFQQGGTIHSTSLQWAKYSGMLPVTAMQNGVDVRENGMILDAVTETGEKNTTAIDPQDYYQTYWSVAAPNLYSASFVKLRELSLSYSLPQSLIGGSAFREVTFGVFGRNLAILSSDLPYLDPQTVTSGGNDQGLENAQVPSTRSIGFNIGLKF